MLQSLQEGKNTCSVTTFLYLLTWAQTFVTKIGKARSLGIYIYHTSYIEGAEKHFLRFWFSRASTECKCSVRFNALSYRMVTLCNLSKKYYLRAARPNEEMLSVVRLAFTHYPAAGVFKLMFLTYIRKGKKKEKKNCARDER